MALHLHRHADTDADTQTTADRPDRRAVVAREREAYGGVKVGAAFFGWLAATGTAVLLTALIAAAGVAVSLATGTDLDGAVDEADRDTVGLAGGIALLAIFFIAYYCGGYVAGRMARFNGARQGFAVWLWAVVMAVVVAAVVAVGADQYNLLVDLNNFPRIPVDEGDLTTAGVVVAIALALSSLAGAVLGGIAGMRFHRKVDRAGLNH
ncbi:MAG TPA: hypothetical protein VEK80_17900 [Kribbellaceae bacterium]|nr:hypothetical protein [Kribbellaceae bacterium]